MVLGNLRKAQRRELAQQVVNLFFAAEREGQDHKQGDKFADIFVGLLDDLELGTKVKLSEHVSHSHDVSKVLIRKMSTAEVAVAGPVLEHSPLLSEDDLVAVAQNSTPEHRLAVSRREAGLTARVTDSLISFGEAPVLRSVTRNSAAEISQKGFESLAVSAHDDEELLARLASRADLPAEAAQIIMPRLTDELRAKLAALAMDEGSALEALVSRAKAEEASQKLNARQERLLAKSLIETIEKKRQTLDDVVLMLADRQRAQALLVVLAARSKLPEANVANAMREANGELLAFICCALGLGADAYLACDELRRATLRGPAVDIAKRRAAYEALDAGEVLKTLRLVSVMVRVA